MLPEGEYADVVVTLARPHGDVDVPLPEWIRVGPGPRPPVGLARAIGARRARTALEEIPLEYHNSPRARQLQLEGRLRHPWGSPDRTG